MKITPVKTRLVVSIIGTTLLSLCVTALLYALHDLPRYRATKKNELQQLVQLISPLLIEKLTATSKPSCLWKELVSQNKMVGRIVLYRSDLTAFDEYVSATGSPSPLSPEKMERIAFSDDSCQYYSPLIVDDETTIGYVAVDYALARRGYVFPTSVVVFVVVFLLSALTVYIISSFNRLQLRKSIQTMVDAAKSIYVDKKYRACVAPQAGDELAPLVDVINEMFTEVGRRETEMQEINEHLESRIETRTTALQEVNTRLRNEKRRGDQSFSVKSDFLANMSHEIRTPLNGIVASCDLAVAEDLSPKVANYLKIIQASSHTLLLIINDILDFSKLEEGTLELENVPFSLAELMCHLGGTFKAGASQKNIDFSLNIDPQIPDILIGDRGRFHQILTNLLDNGVKFTGEGAVSLSIVCLEKTDGKVIVECRVRDTGVGLSEDGLNAIFQSFHQLDSSSTRRFGGAGLGLAITRKLATMMGGSIDVSSTLGIGSTFTVTVCLGWKDAPLMPADDTLDCLTLPPGNLDDIAGKHVLLAENNETNRGIAEAMLTDFGLTVDSFEDGESVLQALSETEYDVIILDIQLPVLDGYKTMQRIRAEERFKDLPIIALTVHASPSDREKCLQAGANACLGKPMGQDRARDMLCRLCNGEALLLPAPSEVKQTPKPVVLDIDGASRKLGVDSAVYQKVLRTFYFDYEGVEAGFKAAIAKADFDWLKKKIHSLKGSSSTIGAEKLTGLATSLDLLCKEGTLPSGDQVHDLIVELEQVRGVAKEFVADANMSVTKDEELEIIEESGLSECFSTLAKALDESLYDQINKEIKNIEKKISGSKVVNLGKIIRMYAYDDALELLHEVATELGISFDNNEDIE